MYATNGNITIHTRPDQIIIITDRFGTAIHLSPARPDTPRQYWLKLLGEVQRLAAPDPQETP